MKLEDIKVGMKVKIPETKSVGCSLKESFISNKAKNNNLQYFYVTSIVYEEDTRFAPVGGVYINLNNEKGGDLFLPEDLEPYEEPINLDLTSKDTFYRDNLGNSYLINECQKEVLNTIYNMNLDHNTTILIMRYLLDHLNKFKNDN